MGDRTYLLKCPINIYNIDEEEDDPSMDRMLELLRGHLDDKDYRHYIRMEDITNR